MLKCEQLFNVSKKEKLSVIESYGITEDQFEERKQKLQEWVDQSEHLPKDYEATLIQGCLLNVKMNMELAKFFIESYFRIKWCYKEIFFDHLVPSSKKFKDCQKFTISAFTSKLTPEFSRIHIIKPIDPEGKAPDCHTYYVIPTLMCLLRGTYDFYASTQIIFDLELVTWRTMAKASSSFLMMIKEILQTMHVRLAALHIVNGSAVVESFLILLKPLLPVKLRERIIVHQNSKTLSEHIPKDCLPQDYGGTDKTNQKLAELWIEALEELEPFFQRIIIDSHSTKKYEFSDFQKFNLGIGLEGSFRQLAID